MQGRQELCSCHGTIVSASHPRSTLALHVGTMSGAKLRFKLDTVGAGRELAVIDEKMWKGTCCLLLQYYFFV